MYTVPDRKANSSLGCEITRPDEQANSSLGCEITRAYWKAALKMFLSFQSGNFILAPRRAIFDFLQFSSRT